MATQRTTTDAMKLVYELIKDIITAPKYLESKPVKPAAEYAVINALPISSGPMQICIVNVNYYAKDLAAGKPDLNTIEAGNAATIPALDGATGDDYLIDFLSQETIRQDGEHFSNMRFEVKLINK